MRVHFELPDDFDRDFVVLVVEVLGAVDVAEGAVAHLLDELIALQAGIARQLALALALLGDYALQDGRVVILLCLLLFLLLVDGVGGGMAGTCGLPAVVAGLRRVFLRRRMSLRLSVVVDVGLADAVRCRLLGSAIVLVAAMLLGVDGGDVGGGLVLRGAGITSLLPVPDEVLEVLDGGHDGGRVVCGRGVEVSAGGCCRGEGR